MPQHVRYVAMRSLVAGHSEDTTYYMNIQARKKDRSRRTKRDRQEMLNGDVATTYYAGVVLWRVSTPPLIGVEAALMREFLDSCEDGQTFSFDPTQWVGGSPTAFLNVVLETTSYSESRAETGSASTDRYSFAFEMRVVS